MNNDTILIRNLCRMDYKLCLEKMRQHTDNRTSHSPDEIWLVEHPPVYTQGQNGKIEHLLNPGNIPVIQSDRGGQITYHGPGQLVVYPLIDIERKKINIRQLISYLENAVIELLKYFQIEALAKKNAPGVYINHAKICSIGLRIRKGRSYHGLALNVNMDLEPFSRINPCGCVNLKMTQLKDLGINMSMTIVSQKLMDFLVPFLGYNQYLID